MKVLITGGSGFLGSHLAERLLAEDNEVLVFDNYETGRRENLDPETKGLTIVEGDIVDREALDEAFSSFKPDTVAHAATTYKDGEAWEHDVMNNTMGTVNVLRASTEADINRFLYFQTGLSYGIDAEIPTPLDHPQPGESSYAITKTAGENFIDLSGLDYVTFRLANIYGPRVMAGPMATFYKRLDEGLPCFVVDARRDQMYVSDLIDLLMQGLGGTGSGPYNVSSGGDRPVKDMFDLIVDAMGVELDYEVEVKPRPADDAPTLLLDAEKTYEDFDWKPSIPMEEGIPVTVEWYRENGVGETYTHLKSEELKVK
ncbi:MAG: NAD-dependent epimerase/dehydratase family protein [Solirubrobacterales bacterium]|nr:NAD-dependent epimerase/dehydratase family protein [Solirubrobacterales bacterium]